MKSTIKGIIIGIIVSTVLFGSVFAATNGVSISTVLNGISISINGVIKAKPGENYKLTNGSEVPYSINYKGTTYLPLRKVAELLDKNVDYIGSNNTAYITDTPGFEKICPIVVNYGITYDVDGVPTIETSITNLSKKTISGLDIFFYMLDKNLKPLVNATGSNILEAGLGDDTTIAPGETIDLYWSADEFKGTVYVGVEVIEVDFNDGSKWVENQ